MGSIIKVINNNIYKWIRCVKNVTSFTAPHKNSIYAQFAIRSFSLKQVNSLPPKRSNSK